MINKRGKRGHSSWLGRIRIGGGIEKVSQVLHFQVSTIIHLLYHSCSRKSREKGC